MTRDAVGKLIRVGPLLAVAGAAGFALAACGGESGGTALATRTGTAVTRTAATPTQSEPTRTLALPAATADATTTAVTTTTTTAVTSTTPGPTTTRPAIIVTTETQSTTVPVPVLPATTAETTSSSSAPWGWIILGIALAALLVTGIALWQRRRSRAGAWSSQAANLNQRAMLALDDVLAQGSVVTGQIQALAAEAASLERRAPDDRARAAVAQVRARLDELAGTLEADRRLRLGSPPPSTEQTSYSTALIRQQAEQLQRVLRPLGASGIGEPPS